MVKVLSLLGSARRGGNTEQLLESVINGAKNAGAEVETVRLSDLSIAGCLNCGGCDSKGVCVQKDDMQELFEKLLTYDLILLASPVYFMGVSAWTKAMIDRCQALWVRKYKLEKMPEISRDARKGVFISVSGMKKTNAFLGAKLTAKSFFATIHVTYIGDIVYRGIDAKGDIEKHPSALAEAKLLGEKIIKEFDDVEFRLP